MELLLFKVITALLTVAITLSAWLGNRMFNKLDELVKSQYVQHTEFNKRFSQHDAEIKLILHHLDIQR